MPIVSNPVPTVTPSKPLTLTEMVARQKNAVDNQYAQLTKLFAGLKAFVWANPRYTPQQVFNAYGTDGAELVRLSAGVSAMLTSYLGVPVGVLPDGITLEIAQDGKVTVNGWVPPVRQSSSSSSGNGSGSNASEPMGDSSSSSSGVSDPNASASDLEPIQTIGGN